MRRLALFASIAIFCCVCCVPAFAADTDGDGVDDAVDCAPSLRSTWAVPAETPELRATGAGRLTWLGAEQAHVYDLYRGAIPAGTPFAYAHECLQPQLLTVEAVDTEEPPPGVLFYYLVGGRNSCGYGVLGYGTVGLLPNDSPCPTDLVADADGDGTPDVDDVCAGTFDPDQEDGDLDGVGTACDVCPASPDPDQSDADGDGSGDACGICPSPTSCDNGLFCDGAETCDPLLGCQAGTPPVLDDGVACTEDSCDEETDAVSHSPSHASCDNGLFCDGAESCDALLGCQAGTPPPTGDGVACTDDACDEAADSLVHTANDASCGNGLFCDGPETCDVLLGCQTGPSVLDDGVACTDDSCDEETDAVVHSPNHASCDNGLFCDGAETCDSVLGCQTGTAPPTGDGVACTDDHCDEATDTPVHTPNHASCGNGLFCDGAESCDALLGCQAGTPPPIDDGVACTEDGCDEEADAVSHAPNPTSCDNGLFCDGAESCDPLLGCRAGLSVVDDGIACTDDSCDEAADTTVHSPNDASCANGLFCDGAETCDVLLGCQTGPSVLDDGVACTEDSCDEETDAVVHSPNPASCDNGLFCDGAESCDALLGCQAGSPPPVDDGVACTDDSCDEATDTIVHVLHDEDSDEVCDAADNCPSVSNAGQSNADGDTNGDVCDLCPNDAADDLDEDGVCGDVDDCPDVFNPGQEDGDGNGVGDACQPGGLVVISEVQYDQSSTQQEFIELYAVQGPANVTSWQLSDGEEVTLPFTFSSSDLRFPCAEPFVLQTGDRVVVFQGTGTPQCSGSYRRIYLAAGPFLGRTGDDVTLRDGSSACVDYVAFENGGDPTDCAWTGSPNPSNDNVVDASLSRFDRSPFADDDLGSDWEASGTTTTTGLSSPGSPNEAGLADSDGDGIADGADNCPAAPNADQADADSDEVGDVCDNCPAASNTSQADVDADGLGNVCDPCPNDAQNDADADGFCADEDNCPTVPNLDQADEDTDGVGDLCDPCLGDPSNDADGDGVCGALDNCPAVHNPGQADLDGDGVGNACEGPQTVDVLIVDQDILSNGGDLAQHRQQPSRRVGLRSGVLHRTLAWFDVSSIPAQSNILSATLVYHTTSGDPQNINANGDTGPSGGQILVDVHEVLRPWNYDEPFTYPADFSDNANLVEAGETAWRYAVHPEEWEQAGASGLSDSGPAIASQPISALLDTQVTISSSALADAVQSWVAGTAPNHGLLIKASDLYEQSVSDNRKVLCGKGFPLETSTNLTEAEAEAQRPFVRIEYELP